MRRMWMLLLVITLMVIVLAVPAMAAEIVQVDGEWPTVTSCPCALAGENGGHVEGCTEEPITWQPWTDSTSLPNPTAEGAEMYYYLTTDVSMIKQGQLRLGKDVKLYINLNGHTVGGTPQNRIMAPNKATTTGAEVVITDSAGGGKLKSSKSYDQGGIFWSQASAGYTITMYAGTIDGTEYTTKGSAKTGGTLLEIATNMTFNMYGGEILGCTIEVEDLAEGAYYPLYGPVFVNGGEFNMYGGRIVGGYIQSNRTYAASTPTNITGGGAAVFIESTASTFCMYGGTIIGGTALQNTVTVDGESSTMTPNGGAIYNKGTFTIKSGAVVSGGTAYSGGSIYNTGTLNLDGGTVQDGSAARHGGCIYTSGTVNMTDGEIKNGLANTVTASGWGGNVYISSGTFTMDDGTISYGTANKNGGSVNIQPGATFTMNDGTLTGGFSQGDQGGNLFVSGTANLNGGTISDGRANNNGGNIATNADYTKGYTVTLNGVTVTGGWAKNNGGNIMLNSVKDNLTTIKGNTQITNGEAGKQGGNLYVSTNAVGGATPHTQVVIESATISGGNAGYGSPDIHVYCTAPAAGAEEGSQVTLTLADTVAVEKYVCVNGNEDAITFNWDLVKAPIKIGNATVYYRGDGFDTAWTSAVNGGHYVTLLESPTETLAVSANMSLDLNGHTVDLLPASDEVKIKLFNSSAADYTVGTGKATGGSIENYVREFVTGSMGGYGHNYRFVTIQEDDGSFTAHRIYMTVKSIVLVPSYTDSNSVTAPAVMYRTVLRCDQTLADLLNDSTGACGLNFVYGTAAQSISYKDKVANFAIVPGADQDNTIRLGITNVLSKNNDTAANKVMGEAAFNNCSAYFTFTDGSGEACTVSSAIKTQGYSLKDLVEDAATKEASAFGSSLKTALGAMYTLWQNEFNDMEWAVSGLAQYAE